MTASLVQRVRQLGVDLNPEPGILCRLAFHAAVDGLTAEGFRRLDARQKRLRARRCVVNPCDVRGMLEAGACCCAPKRHVDLQRFGTRCVIATQPAASSCCFWSRYVATSGRVLRYLGEL